MTKKLLTKLLILFFMFSSSANATPKKTETAILAGGCFWGMQELLGKLDGVISSEVGYIGGTIPNPTYKLVSTGLTNYAESIKVTFDPQKISYEKILKVFFTIHDPTTPDRQQNDVGSQYRSEIFYLNDEQKKIAEKVIAEGNAAKVFKEPIATRVSKAETFYVAEESHQNYLEKNPYGYTCHHVRSEWKF